MITASVSLFVCHVGGLCKNGRTHRHPVWSEDSYGPKKLCIGWESPSSHGSEGEGVDAVFAKLLLPLVQTIASPIVIMVFGLLDSYSGD